MSETSWRRGLRYAAAAGPAAAALPAIAGGIALAVGGDALGAGIAALIWGTTFGIAGFIIGACQPHAASETLAVEGRARRWTFGRCLYLLVAGGLLGLICSHVAAVIWMVVVFTLAGWDLERPARLMGDPFAFWLAISAYATAGSAALLGCVLGAFFGNAVPARGRPPIARTALTAGVLSIVFGSIAAIGPALVHVDFERRHVHQGPADSGLGVFFALVLGMAVPVAIAAAGIAWALVDHRVRHGGPSAARMIGLPRPVRWRRWALGVAAALMLAALGVGATVGTQYVLRWQAQRELDEAIAFVDGVEPRWRLADVEADRQVVPPERNSAVVTRDAFALLAPKWDARTAGDLDNVPPPMELPAALRERITAELRANDRALAKARTLRDLPLGRHRLLYAPDFLNSLITDQQNVRAIAWLLNLDVCDAAHRKDMAQAWQSNRALLNAGRSLGDEPLLISMLVRMAIDAEAVRSLERALALGEMPDDQLRERQQALAAEATVPLFLIGMRGERAGSDLLWTNVETGRLRLLPTLRNPGRPIKAPDSWWDAVSEFFAGAMVRRSHAMLLRHHTDLVEAARLPASDRYAQLRRIDDEYYAEIGPVHRDQLLARLLFTASGRVAQAEQRIQSHLACAVAGLAAERFRLTHERWPRTLEELVQAALLQEVPIDRIDGRPLRYRRTADGVVFYSIGKDRLYDGTALDDLVSFDPARVRVEFRLWNPPQRRQQALAMPDAVAP